METKGHLPSQSKRIDDFMDFLATGPFVCSLRGAHSLHDDNPGFTTNPIKTPKECSSKQKIGPSDHISGVSSSPIFKKNSYI